MYFFFGFGRIEFGKVVVVVVEKCKINKKKKSKLLKDLCFVVFHI